jgi:hypothetical protein
LSGQVIVEHNIGVGRMAGWQVARLDQADIRKPNAPERMEWTRRLG